jgi:hypothetical protein
MYMDHLCIIYGWPFLEADWNNIVGTDFTKVGSACMWCGGKPYVLYFGIVYWLMKNRWNKKNPWFLRFVHGKKSVPTFFEASDRVVAVFIYTCILMMIDYMVIMNCRCNKCMAALITMIDLINKIRNVIIICERLRLL